ncbi:TIGR03084 family metal-binding protein [Nocardioides marinquilinus]|uniref:TIGR03084 family metal-binding protein n=1 Tax=Nocardioides marinquilinus TaxID=1210400 RepID=A0ABP9P9Q3_9ACTN
MTRPTDGLLDGLLADLDAESGALAAVVERAGDQGWTTPTPAAGWTVATQVAHLAWTDEVATLAATDQQRWDAVVHQALADPDGFVDAGAHAIAAEPRELVLARWREGRAALAAALAARPAGERMPWFGPPMSATSMATARLMETWAHSVDVHEALGLEPPVSDRLRHVAHLGVRTRGHAFVTHGRTVPDGEVRVELTGPGGTTWAFGPDDAPERVTGSALDFCLLVTQRVHRADTDLVAEGPGADAWLDVAQCFAGPPGEGRSPR